MKNITINHQYATVQVLGTQNIQLEKFQNTIENCKTFFFFFFVFQLSPLLQACRTDTACPTATAAESAARSPSWSSQTERRSWSSYPEQKCKKAETEPGWRPDGPSWTSSETSFPENRKQEHICSLFRVTCLKVALQSPFEIFLKTCSQRSYWYLWISFMPFLAKIFKTVSFFRTTGTPQPRPH